MDQLSRTPSTVGNLEIVTIQEWRDYYVNKGRLNGWIYEMDTTGSSEAVQQFFDELTTNMDRVEAFYSAKEDAVLLDAEALSDTEGEAAEALKAACFKLYSYAVMNKDMLRNIAIKFDRHVKEKNKGQDGSTLKSRSGKLDWGLAFESLEPRIMSRFTSYRFGIAEERLNGCLESAGLEAEYGDEESSASRRSQPDFKRSGSTASTISSLKVPLKRRQSVLNSVVVKQEKESRVAKLSSQAKTISRANGVAILYFLAITVGVVVWSIYGQSDLLNDKSFVVIWVSIIALTLLVKQWPSDCVMMGATLTLSMLGVLPAANAWKAFSNEVVLSVAALSVVGDAVSHTGFVDILFEKIIGKTTSLPIAMFRIYIPCAIGAATISNTAVMACCMPAIEDWSKKSGHHIGLFLMPISYIMLLAGTFAIFSTSTNLVAQGLLVQHGLDPLGTFELAKPALVLTFVALIYLVLATPIVLGRFRTKNQTTQSFAEKKRQKATRDYFMRLQCHCRAPLPLQDTGLLQLVDIDSVTCLERHGEKMSAAPSEGRELQFGDILELRVPVDSIPGLTQLSGFVVLGIGASSLPPGHHYTDRRELDELVLDQACPLVGKTIVEAKTFGLYEGAIVGMRQLNHTKQVFCAGDQIVLESSAGFSNRFANARDFLAIKKIGVKKHQGIDYQKAYTSGAILLVMLVCVAFSIFPLFACALAAIFGLALTGCADVQDMKKGVSLKVVLTIVGAFGLGDAIGQNGVAAELGRVLVALFSPFGKTGVISAVAVAVVLLGIIFHGTAVVALMFPLCVHVAEQSDIPLHQMIAVLCYSVACQMLSPVSYNTNLMAYAACPEYAFTDFAKLGAPLVVITIVLAIPLADFFCSSGVCM